MESLASSLLGAVLPGPGATFNIVVDGCEGVLDDKFVSGLMPVLVEEEAEVAGGTCGFVAEGLRPSMALKASLLLPFGLLIAAAKSASSASFRFG